MGYKDACDKVGCPRDGKRMGLARGVRTENKYYLWLCEDHYEQWNRHDDGESEDK